MKAPLHLTIIPTEVLLYSLSVRISKTRTLEEAFIRAPGFAFSHLGLWNKLWSNGLFSARQEHSAANTNVIVRLWNENGEWWSRENGTGVKTESPLVNYEWKPPFVPFFSSSFLNQALLAPNNFRQVFELFTLYHRPQRKGHEFILCFNMHSKSIIVAKQQEAV